MYLYRADVPTGEFTTKYYWFVAECSEDVKGMLIKQDVHAPRYTVNQLEDTDTICVRLCAKTISELLPEGFLHEV